jgi:3-methyladenine DNA glycosylase/8-oxoguanine DNA glycosylase
MRFTRRLPPDFDLAAAVCSHGFFLLAPNRWDAGRRTFGTAVAIDNDRAAAVHVGMTAGGQLAVTASGDIVAGDLRVIEQAVTRILRIDEDLSAFHAICQRHPTHQPAVAARFGRLIRSATLFEDIIKVMATCNITWRQTVGIIAAIVERYGAPVARDETRRSFPTPHRLAAVKPADLRTRCKLGYRAEWVSKLTRAVADGTLDLDAIERHDGDSDSLYRRLREIMGVGDYAASNLLMLLGRYDRLAIDSELMRFFRERYPRRKPTPANMRRHYEQFKPFPFLAYWWELWSKYRETNGPSESWEANVGATVTRPQPNGRPKGKRVSAKRRQGASHA